MDNIPRGILFVLLAILCFVSLDTVAKFMGGVLDPLQVVWGRYFFSVLLLPLMVPPRRLRVSLRTKRPWLQLLRSVLLVSTTAVFFTAITFMPLADAIAIGFIAPLIGTALSIPVLGEKVGLRRWSAIAIGFIGMLIVLRPGFEDRHWAYFLPLAAAVMMAGYNVATRLVVRSDSADTSLVWTNVFGAVVSCIVVVAVPGIWQPPGALDWAMLVTIGGLASLGHICLILAFRYAPIGTLAPFTYAEIVLAVIAGWIAFGDWPDIWTFVGAAVIAGAGIYVFRREAQLARGG